MCQYLRNGKFTFMMFVLGIVLHAPLASAIPVVSVQPSSTVVNPGEIFSLDVTINNITDLYAFQFDFNFDPIILSASSIIGGSFLPRGGFTFFIPGTIDNTTGSIAFTADTLLGSIPGVTGSGTLASFSFIALTAGDSQMTLSNVILFDSTASPIDFNSLGGTVNVNVVPEPATWALLGSGLAGFAFVKRRKMKWRPIK